MYKQLITIFFSVSVVKVTAECRRGWFHFGNSCYFFSHTHKSWVAAQGFCHANHAELAIVDSKAENTFIADIIRVINVGIPKRGGVKDDFWIDGTDEVIEGVWTWASTGKELGYTHWSPGQPDNTNKNENCLAIIQWNDYPIGLFNDSPCTVESHFICEMEFPASGAIIGR